MRPTLTTLLLTSTWSWPTQAKNVVHETAPYQLPTGWRYIGPAADSEPLSLSVALKQPGLQELRARLDEISNPSHQDYGLHVSRDLLTRYQAVSPAAVQQVVSWLEDHGISQSRVEDTWIRFNATVGQLEKLLSCKISTYERDGTSPLVYRSKQYSLPEELLDCIDYVYPVTQFLAGKQNKNSLVSDSVERRSQPSRHSVRSGTSCDCVEARESLPSPS